jgi:predicted ArsR family transcriptional regulator
MSRTRWTDPAWSAGVGGRRGEVLATVQAAGDPIGVREIADGLGMHVNTARFHLEGLVTAGLLDRVEAGRPTPGRPPVLYASRVGSPGARSYRMLSQVLADAVSGMPDGAAAVVRAGREWGSRLAASVEPDEEPVPALLGLLRAIGFSPRIRRRRQGVDVELGHCPFQEVAQRDPEVVCGLHGALISGALSTLGADLRMTELEAFVRPDLCVARLRRPG